MEKVDASIQRGDVKNRDNARSARAFPEWLDMSPPISCIERAFVFTRSSFTCKSGC